MIAIPVPGLKQEIGAGDVVKAAVSAVGVEQTKDCGCQKRQQKLNRRVRFVPVKRDA